MVISVKWIRRPRFRHTCEICQRSIRGEYYRFYGGFEDDPKRSAHYHVDCVRPEWEGMYPPFATAVAYRKQYLEKHGVSEIALTPQEKHL